MGLDMYLHGEKFFWSDYQNPENELKEDGFRLSTKILDLGYWRKHPNLHGYIVQNFADGEDNCEKIELSEDDLKQIIEAIEKDALPSTQGFFFGQSYRPGEKDEYSSYEAQKEGDLKIFNAALAWVQDSDKPPALGEPVNIGGMKMQVMEVPEKLPRESRSVYYQASW